LKRVLILGGYGGFGARISVRVAELGFEVLVAGRSADRARRFCGGSPV
jgi:NAD(P)-dependent dehydrogenase (short-subunit alcohol dehydrogenase family)